jgi:multiple sugar transport system permease protein
MGGEGRCHVIPTAYASSRHTRRGPLPARRISRLFAFLLVWLSALVCIGPLVYILVQSFSPPIRGRFGLSPVAVYIFILHNSQLWGAFKNTAIQEAIILAATIFFCPLAGYAYAKFNFRLKGLSFSVMMLTLFFVPIAQTIPLLLEMNEIGWLNTYQGLVVPMTINSLGIFWMTMVIRGVPDELLYAAQLDGCGIFSTWWRIVLPTIKPALLALAFFTYITAYSDFMWPLLVLPDSSMQTVSLYLQSAGFGAFGGGGGGPGGGGSAANVVITSLPTVLTFLCLQRYFMPQLLRSNEIAVLLDQVDADTFRPAAAPGEPIRAVLLVKTASIVVPRSADADSPPSATARERVLALAGLRPWLAPLSAQVVQCTLIAACTFAVYLDALQNRLHLGDVYRVLGNPGVESLAPIWRYFTDPLTSASIPSEAQFRPLLPLSLALEHAITGGSVIGYHLVNLLLVVATALLVYMLVRELLGYWSAPRLPAYRVDFLAMAVALLVAVHPVSGILVNYVSGRDLLLMQMFLCASLFCYVRMQRIHFFVERISLEDRTLLARLLHRWFGGSILGWLGVVALFELALLSKAQAIMLPAVIFAFELTLARGGLSRIATYARAVPFALVAAAHLLYVDAYLHITVLPDASTFGLEAEWTYPLTQAHLSVIHYLANFAWPFNLRQIPVVTTVQTLQDAGAVVGLAFIVGTVVCGWCLRHSQPLPALCMLAYWIVQSPESSIMPMLHNAADYRPYPASPFLFLAVALLLERFLKRAQATIVLLLLGVFFGFASIMMNSAW